MPAEGEVGDMPSSRKHTPRAPVRTKPKPQASSASRRILTTGLLAASVALIGYVLLTWTTVFTVQKVEVTGGPAKVTRAVKRALAPLRGEKLVSLDETRVKEIARGVPGVLAAKADRDFPRTLKVRLTPEKPTAVVRSGDAAWVVSGRGRVIRAGGPDIAGRLPRIWLASGHNFEPGHAMTSQEGVLAAQALSRLPADFPMRVLSAHGNADDLTLVVDSGQKLELRLGEASAFRLKLAVANRILRTLPRAEAQSLAYLDVSVPERPVAATNHQV